MTRAWRTAAPTARTATLTSERHAWCGIGAGGPWRGGRRGGLSAASRGVHKEAHKRVVQDGARGCRVVRGGRQRSRQRVIRAVGGEPAVHHIRRVSQVRVQKGGRHRLHNQRPWHNVQQGPIPVQVVLHVAADAGGGRTSRTQRLQRRLAHCRKRRQAQEVGRRGVSWRRRAARATICVTYIQPPKRRDEHVLLFR